MNNLSDRLKLLVKNLEREDLRTVEALLIDMTGSRIAAQMLQRLLLWWPKATNAEGWVYKSGEDWRAELRIKDNELTRAKGALEMAGVVIKVKKAAVKSDKTISGWTDAPVRHYRLDLRRFLHRLASTLGIGIQKLASLMKKPFQQCAKMVSPNGEKTITTSLQTNFQTDVVVQQAIQEAKKIPGISHSTALKLIQEFGKDAVIRVAPIFQNSSRWRNPAGSFRTALRENWQFEPLESPTPLPPSPDDPAKWADDKDDEADSVEAHVTLGPPPEPETPECAIWKRAYGQLEIQLDRASFDTWVRSARFLRCEGDTYVVGVANNYAREMLQHRLYRDIQRLVRNVAHAEIQLQFEVYERVPVADEEIPLFRLLARQAEVK